VICVDINAPLTPGVPVERKEWYGDVVQVLDEYGEPSPANPDPFSAICFTNFSHHYQVGTRAAPAEYVTVWPMFPEYPLDPLLSERLFNAMSGCGVIPNLDEADPTS
jgi:hypothetical protein